MDSFTLTAGITIFRDGATALCHVSICVMSGEDQHNVWKVLTSEI